MKNTGDLVLAHAAFGRREKIRGHAHARDIG